MHQTPISICVIAKNEEKNIDTFFSAIKKHMGSYPYEIILTDTGSTDRTVEIAAKYTNKIFHFEWINDFSAARNYSISCAKNDWILVLDCDEFIAELNPMAFDWMAKNYPRHLGAITIRSHYDLYGTDTVHTSLMERFFNRKFYHYESMIHEQICAIDDMGTSQVVDISLSVEHGGYNGTPEEQQRKIERNNTLLFQMLEKQPNDPYVLFQLGQSYNMVHDYEKSCYYYGEGLNYASDPQLTYVNLMVIGYGHALLHLGRLEEALLLENIYDDFCHTADFVCLMGFIYLKNGMYVKAMQEFLKATTMDNVQVEGSNSFMPLYYMGYINEVLGDTASAITLYKKCGQYPLALTRIAALTTNTPAPKEN